MEITTFFDPYNKQHVQAYRILMDTGSWPEKFLPENITFTTAWQAKLALAIAEAWVNAVENDQVCMDITNFIDPTKKLHVEAHKHLEKTGQWPENFIPKGMVLGYNWQMFVNAKMRTTWWQPFFTQHTHSL